MAGEVFVVVTAFRHLEAGGRLDIAVNNRSDVIRPMLLIRRERVEDEPGEAALIGARLGQRRHVRRRDTAVRRFRCKLVRERRREDVGRTAAALGGIALLVEVLDAIRRRQRLDLRRVVTGPARVREIAEGDVIHRMAVRADFLVDLEAALQLALVVGAEGPGK